MRHPYEILSNEYKNMIHPWLRERENESEQQKATKIGAYDDDEMISTRHFFHPHHSLLALSSLSPRSLGGEERRGGSVQWPLFIVRVTS